MLDFAIKYIDDINKIYHHQIIGNEQYKYWNYCSYWDHKIVVKDDDEWTVQRRVSIDNDDRVIGYFYVIIQRPENRVSDLSIMAMDPSNGIILLRDLAKLIDQLFMGYRYYKMNWRVLSGNPAQKIYDKFISKYDGRIVGIKKDHILLTDGQLYDEISYELLRSDYLKTKENK